MKYGEIINPEDVPAMMRSGELKFGILLEFGDTPEFDTIGTRILIFCGFMENTGEFLCSFKNESTPRLYRYARFPRPNLRDGDPVIGIYHDGSEFKGHFRLYEENGGIQIYHQGRTRWTAIVSSHFLNWRLPTKKELREAGMENWYDGRIELEDE